MFPFSRSNRPPRQAFPGPITVEEIRSVRFAKGGRSDYRAEQVDDFLDALAAKVAAGEPIDQMVHRPRFRLSTKFDGAYLADDVDAFIDSLQGRPVAPRQS